MPLTSTWPVAYLPGGCPGRGLRLAFAPAEGQTDPAEGQTDPAEGQTDPPAPPGRSRPRAGRDRPSRRRVGPGTRPRLWTMSLSPESRTSQTPGRPELATVRGPVTWSPVGRYEDIRLDVCEDGIAKVTICRPEVRNAFRPQTLIEISDALTIAREDPGIGVIILTGEGPDAFCSGGDQRVRGDTGYLTDPGQPGAVGRFHVTDLQIQIRRLPKPVVAMVAGYAIGGGHVLHLICDLTVAADNARFGQVGPKVGSFDGGYGAALLAELVGVKKAKEIWFLCFQYGAQEALDMGLVNTVVPLEELEAETVAWCRRMLQMSPFALRLMKASFHAAEDGMAGIQQLAHDANLLFYSTEEAREGREAFKAKRRPEFERFPRRP